MDKKEYQKKLPKKRVSAGALFLNKKDEILIVKPTYKDYWSLPGGTVDANESPKEACKREIQEELNLDIEPGKLLSVGYVWPESDNLEIIKFLFFGGFLDEKKINKIKLQEDEIEKYQFFKLETVKTLVSQSGGKLIEEALQTYKSKEKSVYLES
ncbi:NUDIX hydrolase [candidate division WS5 bacterium]|uniref:NUDIX hydrolase n=1 Tax=candidate division WS5 bacterium TaxID=2093353 RepID=A0A419DGV3_9BACT|nr:MAG: NUDIX hydrolase [candidate division WS5 bacterium]